VGTEESRIFGRPRNRQDTVECNSAWYYQFRSTQELRSKLEVSMFQHHKRIRCLMSTHKDMSLYEASLFV
jgi:hypothetical protein